MRLAIRPTVFFKRDAEFPNTSDDKCKGAIAATSPNPTHLHPRSSLECPVELTSINLSQNCYYGLASLNIAILIG